MGTAATGVSYPWLVTDGASQRRGRPYRGDIISSYGGFQTKLLAQRKEVQKYSNQHVAPGKWKLCTSCKFLGRWSLCSPDESRHKAPIMRRMGVFSAAASGKQVLSGVLESDQDPQEPLQDIFKENIPSVECEAVNQKRSLNGKAGFVSFYGAADQHLAKEDLRSACSTEINQSFVWILGPVALVASVVLPPFYLRKFFEAMLEDSLLTDFLILFFTEALFYSGVAVFLFVTNYMQSACLQFATTKWSLIDSLRGHKILSTATLVLSVLLPLVCMGLVWPWTGPAASAAIAPYLVGLIVQFAFEQYVQRKKSSVRPLVPVVFQVYRLHQLNRATQLVVGLMFSLRGAETTPQILAINGSLQTLLNVLQVLGIICLWSLVTSLMGLFPSRPEAVSL